MLPVDRYVESLDRDAAAFVALLRDHDPSLPVPHCPGWTLLDLARHLGSVHRWALTVVTTGERADEPEAPVQHEAVVAWCAEGADRLVSALHEVDAGRPTWTFGPPPRLASFWSRRQAHETAIHLLDALDAAGGPRDGVLDPELAADGVDEVVTMFFPRQVRLGRTDALDAGVRLLLTDLPGFARVLAGDGTDTGPSYDATVSGPARDVLLALWGRARLSELEVAGDAAAARAAFAHALTP